jgi:hypothetical protein
MLVFLGNLSRDNVFEPPWRSVAFEQYGIEPTRRINPVLTQIDGRSVLEFPALVGSDTGAGAAKGRTGALTHLDEHPRGPVSHDQIKLAATAAPVAPHQDKPLFL